MFFDKTYSAILWSKVSSSANQKNSEFAKKPWHELWGTSAASACMRPPVVLRNGEITSKDGALKRRGKALPAEAADLLNCAIGKYCTVVRRRAELTREAVNGETSRTAATKFWPVPSGRRTATPRFALRTTHVKIRYLRMVSTKNAHAFSAYRHRYGTACHVLSRCGCV